MCWARAMSPWPRFPGSGARRFPHPAPKASPQWRPQRAGKQCSPVWKQKRREMLVGAAPGDPTSFPTTKSRGLRSWGLDKTFCPPRRALNPWPDPHWAQPYTRRGPLNRAIKIFESNLGTKSIAFVIRCCVLEKGPLCYDPLYNNQGVPDAWAPSCGPTGSAHLYNNQLCLFVCLFLHWCGLCVCVCV